jgi:hypothetical protein
MAFPEREPETGTTLRRAALELELIDTAKAGGASWAVIGATLGMSGREAKRAAHKLRSRVKRAAITEALESAAPADGPYMHEMRAPVPGERYVPYSVTGPGVIQTWKPRLPS